MGLFVFNSHLQRMTEDDHVQPNDRMMEVLARAYNLPCNKPVIAVSSCQFVNSPSASESNNLLEQYFAFALYESQLIVTAQFVVV